MIKLKFTAVTNSTDLTPILKDYKVSSLLTSNFKKVYWAKVRVGKDVANREGIKDANDYSSVKTALDNARSNTWLTTIKDLDENTRYVRFIPNQSAEHPFRTPVRWEKNRPVEWEYNLFMIDYPLE
jgi:hypothetical protein